MTPGWVVTRQGLHLRGRRTRDTEPELRLRSAVHRMGLRFRIHRPIARNCTPDFVLPRWRVAVFVDGCFWHGCPAHTARAVGGPNADRWREKLEVNRERDIRNDATAADAGWKVIRLWECAIKDDVAACAAVVADACVSGSVASGATGTQPR